MSSFTSRCSILTMTLLVIALLSSAAYAQSITGSVSGTVVDPNGGVVAGATVTLVNDQNKAARTLATNDSGRFSFAALQPGTYTLKVEHQGFQSLLRQAVVVSANEGLAIGELKMQPGQVSETVTVTSEGALVEKESSDLTARLTSDQLALISTKGRDVTSLLRLLPGTSNIPDTEAVGDGFGTTLPNFSGGRGRSTVATVDGLNASEPSGSNLLSMTTSQDAIAEVKVLRDNYSAEYGNNGGAMINLVTKGGGKDYAGTAYYFLRNEALNGNNFFSNRGGLKRPLYRHNIWGFNIGGPLTLPRFGEGRHWWMKDKAFFFFNLEKPHTITPTDPVFVTVPSALERAGDFSQSINSSGVKPIILDPLTGLAFPGNVIPAARINKSGQALLNYFPQANATKGTTGAAFNYIKQQSQDTPKHSYVIRFDVKPTNNDSVYFKAQWWTSDNEGLGTAGWPNTATGRDRWGITSHYLYTDDGRSANWVHIFNSSVVNEFNMGWRTDTEGFIPSTGFAEGLQRSALGYTSPQLFPANNTLGLIPRVTGWTSVSGNAANINWLDRWGEVGEDHIKPSISDNISYTRGSHSYKFGFYYERLLNREAPGGQWSGVFDFGNSTTNGFTTAAGNTGYAYANALLGNFNSYTENNARPFTNEQLTLLQWYGQDQWKVNKKLTLSYGMRFGYHSPFFQIDGQGSNFNPLLFSLANAPLLYLPYCNGQPNGLPAFGTACSAANQFAIDPRQVGVVNPTLVDKRFVRSFVPGTGSNTNGLALPTDPTTPKGYRHAAPIDFEPRLGFAWDVFGTGKTILRGMGGTYHSPRIGGGTGGASSLGNNPPQQRTFVLQNGSIDLLPSLINTSLIFPTALSGVEAQSTTPTSYNFSIGLQQDVGFKTVIELSYVGSQSRHLGQRRNLNGVPDGAKLAATLNCPAGSTVITCNRDAFTANAAKNNDFLRPFRGYGDANVVTWDGNANYNSIQVQINRRYTRGFQYGVAYTYSKSFDYANDDTSDLSFPRPYKAFNYAASDFDQTHIFTLNYIYDFPSLSKKFNDNAAVKAIFDNWQLSGTTSYATGRPKNNLAATYTGGTTDYTGGQVNARPNMTCDPMKGISGSAPNGTPYVINVTCFARPTAIGQIGNMPRNAVRIPPTFNSDVAFFKNVPFGERRAVQLRWEMYNIFNRANFNDIDGNMTFDAAGVQTNSNFGTPTTARFPRVMQGSIRINF